MSNSKRKRQKSTESKEAMTSFTIAVSSCALFTQGEGDNYFTGVAFPFVKALEKVNKHLAKLQPAEEIKTVLIPANGQDKDHLKKNIKIYNLSQCGIADEKALLDSLKEIKPVLYLSTNSQNVREAIKAGYGAATLFQRDNLEHSDDVLRVAFDGDGVLFSDESERVYIEKELEGFFKNEHDLEDKPLEQGPLADFFEALVKLQKKFNGKDCPVRTYLVTSRGTPSPGIRVLKGLQEQNLQINEAFLLCGANKGPVLKAIKPHIFFDDQITHVQGALQNGVIGAHVPYGVRN